MDAYIVIAVLILMIIAFVMNKWPFGLITMTCCIVLGVTGVLDTTTAFSGLCNPMLVMMAGAIVVTNAFAKTSFIKGLQKRIIRLQNGKTGKSLMLVFVIAIFALATFMPTAAVLTIVFMMACNLSDEGEVNAARVIFPASALTTIWSIRMPIGLGAGQFAILNSFLEPYGKQYTVSLFDPMLAGLVPGILLSLYTIFCYKLLPKKNASIKNEMLDQGADDKNAKMSKRDEIITYIVFAMMMIFMIFNQFTGQLLYIGPALCVVILVFAKIITVEEVKRGITADLIFMMAGIFTLTAALTDTGAGEMIGKAIISLFGGATSEIGLVALFAGIAIIITNFMSNNATMYALIPVAVTTGIAAGINPAPAVLAIDVAVKCAFILPSASGEAAMCYGASGYNFKETLKFTIPAQILFYIGTVAGIYCIFC